MPTQAELDDLSEKYVACAEVVDTLTDILVPMVLTVRRLGPGDLTLSGRTLKLRELFGPALRYYAHLTDRELEDLLQKLRE